MPEQLSSQLIELRERCAAFAEDHMLPLADSDRASAAVQVREASKAAGLFTMTQPDHAAGQLALCVARDNLSDQQKCIQVPGILISPYSNRA